jgi:hypothetical protein
MKRLPSIPSAFPILFLGPTLRFQEMKKAGEFGQVGERIPLIADPASDFHDVSKLSA